MLLFHRSISFDEAFAFLVRRRLVRSIRFLVTTCVPTSSKIRLHHRRHFQHCPPDFHSYFLIKLVESRLLRGGGSRAFRIDLSTLCHCHGKWARVAKIKELEVVSIGLDSSIKDTRVKKKNKKERGRRATMTRCNWDLELTYGAVKFFFYQPKMGKKIKIEEITSLDSSLKLRNSILPKKKKEKRKLRRESIRNANALIVSKKKVCTVAVRTEIKWGNVSFFSTPFSFFSYLFFFRTRNVLRSTWTYCMRTGWVIEL